MNYNKSKFISSAKLIIKKTFHYLLIFFFFLIFYRFPYLFSPDMTA
jgi:hypothetical protein